MTMTDPQALRRFRASLTDHALTTSEKADVLQTLNECADEIERLRRYVDVMNGKPGTERHTWLGLCPDNDQPDSRDEECPACRLLLSPNA